MNNHLGNHFEKLEKLAYLKIENKIYPIHNGVNTIGRNKDAVVNIKHLNVSQQHSVIVIADGVHYIADLKSSNGTVLSGAKLAPFKLYKLETESEISFGNIGAQYYKQIDDRILDADPEQSQLSTQSVYNAETQIIQNETISNKENTHTNFTIPSRVSKATNLDIIHEAATQVVDWGDPKIPSTSKAEIHDAPTQVVNLESPVNPLGDHSYEKSIGIRESQTSFTQPYDNFFDESHFEIRHDGPEVDKLPNAPEGNLDEPGVSAASRNKSPTIVQDNTPNEKLEPQNEQHSNNDTSQSTNSKPTDNDKIESRNDTVDSTILQQPSTSGLTKENEIVKINSCSSGSTTEPYSYNLSLSQISTCDEIIQNKKKVKPLESDSTSASEEIIRSKHKMVKKLISDSTNTSDEVIKSKRKLVRKLESDSDTDIEADEETKSSGSEEVVVRKRKSVPLPATQTIDSDTEQKEEDPIIEDSSECESDVEDTRSKRGVDGVPSLIIQETQEQDLNDSDCIPATQDVLLQFPKQLPISQKSSQRSTEEESFKLGLTEMMTESEKVNPVDTKCTQEKTSQVLPENVANVAETSKKNVLIDESDDDATDIEDNIDEISSKTVKPKVCAPEGSFDLNTITDYEPELTTVRSKDNSILDSSQSDGEVHLLPTQPIDEAKPEILPNKILDESSVLIEATQDENLYCQPTQKLYEDKVKDSETQPNDDVIYCQPTQQISQVDKIDDERNIEDNICIQETEPLEYEANLDEIDLKSPSNKAPGSSSIVHIIPSERRSNPDDIIPNINDEHSKENSKKFTFKKYNLVLEESLTNILSEGSSKKQQGPTDGNNTEPESMEVNFAKEVEIDREAKDRPSNPLAVLLEKDNANCMPSTSKENYIPDSETLSQIDAFVKSSKTVDEPGSPVLNSQFKSPRKIIKKPLSFEELEDSLNKTSENLNIEESKSESTKEVIGPMSPVRETETISQIDRFIESSFTKQPEIKTESIAKLFDYDSLSSDDDVIVIKPPEMFLKPSAPSPKRQKKEDLNNTKIKQEKLKESKSEEEERPETISQIDRFIQSSSEKKIIEKGTNKPIDHETLSQIDAFIKATDIWVDPAQSIPIKKRKQNMNNSNTEKRTNNNVKPELTSSNRTTRGNSSTNLPSILEESSGATPIKKQESKTRTTRRAKQTKDSTDETDSDKSEPTPKRRNAKSRKLSVSIEEPSTSSRNITIPEDNSLEVSRASCSNISIENSRSEVNQSIALLEVNNRKTRKSQRNDVIAEEVTIKVPKNRRSMSVTFVEDTKMESDIKPFTVELARPTRRTTQNKVKEENVVKNMNDSRKRKTGASSSNESLSVASSSSAEDVSTPSKKKKTALKESVPTTPERSKRKLKPKVVFTMLDNPSLESSIRSMGGSIVDSVAKATVLVTEHVKRSQKLLSAVGQGKPICSPKWILSSKRNHEFLDPWDHILVDKEAETKWSFSLQESLRRSSESKLLENYSFLILVTAAVDVLKGAIESCGGKVAHRCPAKCDKNKFFIISTPEHKSKYSKLIKQHPDLKVVEPEAIFDGVLRQELRFDKHYLS